MSNKHTFWAPNISSEFTESTSTPSVAVIQSLLKGYGVEFDEHRLWAVNQQVGAPQTLHQLAKEVEPLGLEAELVTVPADLLLSDLSILPILVAGGTSGDAASSPDTTIDTGASPLEGFIVIWNKVGPFFQVIDSQSGRRWLRHTDLLALLAAETVTLSPRSSQNVLESESFKSLLRSRLHDLGVDAAYANEIIDASSGEGDELALLDAAARMAFSMVQDKEIGRGKSAQEVVRVLVKSAASDHSLISEEYWSIEADSKPPAEAPPSIRWRAVAALRIYGWDEEKFKQRVAATAHKTPAEGQNKSESVAENAEQEQALPSFSARFDLLKFLLADGLFPRTVWITIIIMAATGIFFQAVLFRGMMNLMTTFNSLSQRLWLVVLISAFIITILLLQWFIEQIGNSMGQRLNSRLRLTLLSMLPNLSSHYFRDTSPAEMIDIIHSGRASELSPLFLQFSILGITQLLFMVLGLAWIDPLSGLLAAFMVVALVVGMVARLQLRTKLLAVLRQRGVLSRFYGDAMQGLVAIRTHSAERAVRREYESSLSTWGKKKLEFYVSKMWFWAYDALITYVLISLIIVLYALRTDDPSHLLLLTYWCINIDQIARNQLSLVVMVLIFSFTDIQRYGTILEVPAERDLIPVKSNGTGGVSTDSTVVAPSMDEVAEEASQEARSTDPPWEKSPHGMAIAIQQVRVRVGEHVLLKNITLDIPAGSHIGIVGTSGAGKSTLIGLLLGWHYPDSGQLLIDNQPLSYEDLLQLRQETAWVDPSIQLWNRSLLYNLYYADQQVPLNIVIEQADLRGVLERLEHGLQTPLGSEGRSLSGGQGQRVRFGRGLQRKDARLVILDEAFRGLDRGKRRILLARARKFWSKSTLICVTHDVGQTLNFERVLVLDNGKIIEDGDPLTLAKQPESRYAALLTAEENVHEKLWSKHNWRRLWLDRGRFTNKTDDKAT